MYSKINANIMLFLSAWYSQLQALISYNFDDQMTSL